MNLSSLAAPIWLMLCSVSGVLYGYQPEHFPFLGLLIGVFAGNLSLIVLLTGHAVSMAWSSERPRCRCGAIDYEFIGSTGNSPASIVWLYRCPDCGRRYGREGSRFLRFRTDGTPARYMRQSRLGRWALDEADEPSS